MSFFAAASSAAHGDGEEEVDPEICWLSRSPVLINHPDSLTKCCVTTPSEMLEYVLYTDNMKRFLRPRRALTEFENQQPTLPHTSENLIWFDVYIKRLTVNEQQRGLIKADPPRGGDRLTLKLKGYKKIDQVSVPEFPCIVEEVFWGWLKKTDPESGHGHMKKLDTVGLILVRVLESYPRSLIIDSNANMRRALVPLAA
jgi:hypothetical protein